VNHRPMIGRADLLRCVLRYPENSRVFAELCGYSEQRPLPKAKIPSGSAQASVVVTSTATGVAAPVAARSTLPAFRRFLVPLRYRAVPASKEPPPEADWQREPPVTQEELSAAREPPEPPPLTPWSRLWPLLHDSLGTWRPGHRLDFRALIRQLARVRPVRDIPRRPVLTWASRASILIDQRPDLAPYHADFAGLVRRLARQRGRDGLTCVRLNSQNPTARGRCWWTERERAIAPAADVPVLVLSDLGFLYRSLELRRFWLQFGLDLQRSGCRATAFVPSPPARWDVEVSRLWHCVCWDRNLHVWQHADTPLLQTRKTPERESQQADRLLDLLSPAFRIEPALLRSVRLLLPLDQADVGTEYDVWHHQDASRTLDAMAFRSAAALKRRAAFARCDEKLKLAVAESIRQSHQRWSITYFARETLNLHEDATPLPPTEIDQARRILSRLNRTMFDIAVSDPQLAQVLQVFEWQQIDFARASAAARSMPETAVAWAIARTWRGSQAVAMPEELDRDEVKRTQELLLAAEGRSVAWEIRRAGPDLALGRSSTTTASGVPVALLPAAAPRFDLALTDEDNAVSLLNLLPRPTAPTLRVPVRGAEKIFLRSDRGELALEMVAPPRWATRFGWDRRGMVADFAVKGALFTLRWIPPGEFFMGSPEDEPGRFEWEGPQHRVTIGRGFWLGETPVTQGQYAAVTGQRPSYFEHAGDRAPVEQVDWDECQAFCEKLAGLVPDFDSSLSFRLPSEAEWEYACRGGTTGALYTGPLTILGAYNGPELDAIAWYGGNSRVEYEGGVDSSDWKEKQYDHQRAGTHPVRQKRPNPWGLYDMLGNVWEWCEDGWHSSYTTHPATVQRGLQKARPASAAVAVGPSLPATAVVRAATTGAGAAATTSSASGWFLPPRSRRTSVRSLELERNPVPASLAECGRHVRARLRSAAEPPGQHVTASTKPGGRGGLAPRAPCRRATPPLSVCEPMRTMFIGQPPRVFRRVSPSKIRCLFLSAVKCWFDSELKETANLLPDFLFATKPRRAAWTFQQRPYCWQKLLIYRS
jgi:formylglycine-generating enzyme required for sulfatase activity